MSYYYGYGGYSGYSYGGYSYGGYSGYSGYSGYGGYGGYGYCNPYPQPQQTTYEFTAFAEDDLLRDGDMNLGCGDSFTMPGAATVCIEVTYNDNKLSGDNRCNENANDRSGQNASISGSDGELGNGGQIYAESYYWVKDSDGNWYVMIEIEQEGTNDDYFTFYTGSGYSAPEPGTELTVHSVCNVTSNWISFDNLDAGEKLETGAIDGSYFCDEDGDGVLDAGEGGLAGFTVVLEGAGTDGTFGTADDVELTATTDENGNFSLADVEAGTYRGVIGNTMVGEFTVSAGATAEVTVGAECLEIPTDGLFLGDLEASAANKARFGFPNDGTVRGDWEYSAADGKLSGDILLDFVMLADGTMTTFTNADAPVLLFDVNLDLNGDIAASDAQDLLVFEDADGNGVLDAGETVLLSAQAVASGIGVDGDIDFIFEVTGGTLQDDFDALIAMQVGNDPTTFTSLEEDFTGRPKGFIGDLAYDSFCFVDDMAVA